MRRRILAQISSPMCVDASVLAGAASVVMGSGQRRVPVAGSVRHGGAGFERSSMTTLFNHTIVAARDKQQAASFFTEM